MALPVFTFCPEFGAREVRAPRTSPFKFGNGKERRYRFGLITDLRTWELSFDYNSDAQREQLLAFLEDRGAWKAFEWTDPKGHLARWRCKEWRTTWNGTLRQSITCTFTQIDERVAQPLPGVAVQIPSAAVTIAAPVYVVAGSSSVAMPAAAITVTALAPVQNNVFIPAADITVEGLAPVQNNVFMPAADVTVEGLAPVAQGDLSIGEAYEGGFFVGYISHTADGVPTHALIVAPRATGASGTGYTLTTMLQWKNANTTTAGTTNLFDGAVNTAAMVTAGIASHPAAEFCENLSIGGYTDWYLPSRYELDIAYQGLKPTTDSNTTFSGINPYSVPERTSNRDPSVPAQTSITAFQSGGAEAFIADVHWSSSEGASNTGWTVSFLAGGNGNSQNKTTTLRVRAFRKAAL